MKRKILRPIVKIHGGKYYLWKHIVNYFPLNYTKLNYVEPYIGAGSVFLNKEKSKVEIINDIDPGMIAIWRAIKADPVGFIDELLDIEYKLSNFMLAKNDAFTKMRISNKNYNHNYAINEYVLRRMSRGGLQKSFAKSRRLRGGKMGDLNAWNTSIKQLINVYDRVKSAIIYNVDALQIIQLFDDTKCLYYLDPPYLDETRVSKKAYEYEMDKTAHIKLLDLVTQCKSKIIISGYHSVLYSKALKNWNIIEKVIVNHSSQQKKKPTKVEVLWKNY